MAHRRITLAPSPAHMTNMKNGSERAKHLGMMKSFYLDDAPNWSAVSRRAHAETNHHRRGIGRPAGLAPSAPLLLATAGLNLQPIGAFALFIFGRRLLATRARSSKFGAAAFVSRRKAINLSCLCCWLMIDESCEFPHFQLWIFPVQGQSSKSAAIQRLGRQLSQSAFIGHVLNSSVDTSSPRSTLFTARQKVSEHPVHDLFRFSSRVSLGSRRAPFSTGSQPTSISCE